MVLFFLIFVGKCDVYILLVLLMFCLVLVLLLFGLLRWCDV